MKKLLPTSHRFWPWNFIGSIILGGYAILIIAIYFHPSLKGQLKPYGFFIAGPGAIAIFFGLKALCLDVIKNG